MKQESERTRDTQRVMMDSATHFTSGVAYPTTDRSSSNFDSQAVLQYLGKQAEEDFLNEEEQLLIDEEVNSNLQLNSEGLNISYRPSQKVNTIPHEEQDPPEIDVDDPNLFKFDDSEEEEMKEEESPEKPQLTAPNPECRPREYSEIEIDNEEEESSDAHIKISSSGKRQVTGLFRSSPRSSQPMHIPSSAFDCRTPQSRISQLGEEDAEAAYENMKKKMLEELASANKNQTDRSQSTKQLFTDNTEREFEFKVGQGASHQEEPEVLSQSAIESVPKSRLKISSSSIVSKSLGNLYHSNKEGQYIESQIQEKVEEEGRETPQQTTLDLPGAAKIQDEKKQLKSCKSAKSFLQRSFSKRRTTKEQPEQEIKSERYKKSRFFPPKSASSHKAKKIVVRIDREGAKTSRSTISREDINRPDFEEVRLRKEILHLDKALKIKQRNEVKDATSLEIRVMNPAQGAAQKNPVKTVLRRIYKKNPENQKWDCLRSEEDFIRNSPKKPPRVET